jgi:hypothetical protein
MTIHQCPKCELRFDWKTELDDHCWHDHPQFRHEYPARAVPAPDVAPAIDTVHATPAPGKRPRGSRAASLVRWVVPR